MGLETRLREEVTRREFLKLVPALPTLMYPNVVDAQSDRKQSFQRTAPLNLQALPFETLLKISLDEPITQKELDSHIQILQQQYPSLRGRKPIAWRAYNETTARFEPDADYAQNLIREARASIDDVIRFLNSPYISRQNVEFQVPSRSSDVRLSGSRNMVFYLVAGYRSGRSVEYTFTINGKNFVAKLPPPPFIGHVLTNVKLTETDKGILVEPQESGPIFYNTLADTLQLVEAPPIEFLHGFDQAARIKNFCLARYF